MARDADVAWSPAGDRVAFTGEVEGVWRIASAARPGRRRSVSRRAFAWRRARPGDRRVARRVPLKRRDYWQPGSLKLAMRVCQPATLEA